MKEIWLTLALLMIISGCRVERKEKEMSSKNEPQNTYCVGRHTVGLPGSFTESPVTTGTFKGSGLSAQDPSFDVVVRAMGMTRSQFASEVQKRRAEIAESSSGNVKVLRLEKEVSDDTTLFRVQEIDDAYVSEVILLRGSSVVTVRLESYRGQFLAAEESLIKFAAGIKDKHEEVGGEQSHGFCLGPVVVTGEFNDENGSFLFRNNKGADFGIEIVTYTPDEQVPLLARMSGSDSLLTIFDVRHKVLRARERTLAGMRAQEWLGWARLSEEQDAKTLKFVLETMRPTPGKTTPGMHLTFETAQPLEDGSPTKTLMSDDEAIQLWDSVVNSIRLATG
ncbi:MAG: T6SS immunity protein Tli4 family protein [Massilia sp.]